MPQNVAPSLPYDAEERSEAATEESADPTGETYPWDVEFTGEGYNLIEANICDIVDYTKTVGKSYEWHEGGFGSPCARMLRMYDNGDIEDFYYYPNRTESHTYWWGADGFYREVHYLDNGYVETMADGSQLLHMGTMLYLKEIKPDGSYHEMECYHNTNSKFSIRQDADGYYEEYRYFEDGSNRKFVIKDPAAGTYQEVEYFSNGNVKHTKKQTSECSMEERYDEEGFHTYYYSKDVNFEIELISDDTGKLVKTIENGTVIEDAATLAQYVPGYNFRQ